MDRRDGYVLLEDGTLFRGRSVGAPGAAFGEAVFTTAMTGYQETVTDPSYAEQLVCFTAPMVGNYGVADGRGESERPHAKAALMRQLGGAEWASWLAAHGLVGLEEIDTRALVLRLRADGKQVIGFGGKNAAAPFVASCTRFLYLDEVRTPTQTPRPKPSADQLKQDAKLIKMLRRAIEAQADADGWAFLGGVGSHISNQGSFDSRNYGFPKLGDLVAEAS